MRMLFLLLIIFFPAMSGIGGAFDAAINNVAFWSEQFMLHLMYEWRKMLHASNHHSSPGGLLTLVF